MKKYFIVIVVLLFALTGCSEEKIKDNQVYVVEENISNEGESVQNNLVTKGLIPFEEYKYLNEDEEYGRILLAADSNYKYYMEIDRDIKDVIDSEIIKGENKQLVKIFKIDKRNEEQELIAVSVPFVSQVKWNKDQTIIGFCGGNRLTVYNTVTNKLLLEDLLVEDEISYFAWSPKEANKLYTEKENLANSSIYYTDLQKRVEFYETKEDLYYKGNLDNQYYYASKWLVVDKNDKTKTRKDIINTFVIDDKGLIVKDLGEGRFRDSYKKSVVKIGENGFGLYYIKDINNPDKTKKLTGKYIYDVKFVGDGKIAYIVEGSDISKNFFLLKIIDENSKLVDVFEVSGSSMVLSPNGKSGYIGGPLLEKVNFETFEIDIKANLIDLNHEENQRAKKHSAIRGAMNTLYQFETMNIKDFQAVEKYYIDSLSPQQWANFDLITMFKESRERPIEGDWHLEIVIKEDSKNLITSKTSYVVNIEAKDSTGKEQTKELALELLEKNSNWYVTGLSTFPGSKERISLEKTVKKYIDDAQKGRKINKELENKEVSIGQIQFWDSNMSNLASEVSDANYAKVYLIVGENHKVIYKLVLKKENKNWKTIDRKSVV